MSRFGRIRRDQKGVGAAEFALVAPVLISFVVGVSQLGRLFFANADMHNAIAAGARVASVWPVPDDATILAAVNNRLVRTNARTRATPSVVHGTDANGNAYVEISMTYSVPLEFIFFETPPVTLRDTRRVFTQVADELENGGGSTTSATSSTTTGGTSTTSASSTGGTTTSTTSASSTSSGGNGNGSSSGNNGSSGHAHGNCNRNC
ncbi:MAG TPA: TadE/TadG family type IV pilus assembly protein [Allosphingosinicella sp.]|nr:TadE/TadG family type IV pilus assembly protein [Allosphingosinicella sp.]